MKAASETKQHNTDQAKNSLKTAPKNFILERLIQRKKEFKATITLPQLSCIKRFHLPLILMEPKKNFIYHPNHLRQYPKYASLENLERMCEDAKWIKNTLQTLIEYFDD